LVHVITDEGFRLDGVVIRPGSAQPTRPLAVVCVPGLYATFSDPPYVSLGRELAALGYACIIGNDRGHDFGAVVRRRDGPPVCAGGGWERLEESALDAGAWVRLARALGFGAVVLLGHSLGARKVVYYQVQRQDPHVVGLIAASPAARRSPPADPRVTALAQAMVAAGRGRNLLPWPAVGCSMSAQTYLDHELRKAPFQNIYVTNAPDGRAPMVAQVRCPLLAFFGAAETVEGHNRAPELQTIRQNALAASRVEALLIDGADHLYTDHERDVATVVARWVDTLH
jgi:pimeloyl-ACP methyl ester carboxylesterase